MLRLDANGKECGGVRDDQLPQFHDGQGSEGGFPLWQGLLLTPTEDQRRTPLPVRTLRVADGQPWCGLPRAMVIGSKGCGRSAVGVPSQWVSFDRRGTLDRHLVLVMSVSRSNSADANRPPSPTTTTRTAPRPKATPVVGRIALKAISEVRATAGRQASRAS